MHSGQTMLQLVNKHHKILYKKIYVRLKCKALNSNLMKREDGKDGDIFWWPKYTSLGMFMLGNKIWLMRPKIWHMRSNMHTCAYFVTLKYFVNTGCLWFHSTFSFLFDYMLIHSFCCSFQVVNKWLVLQAMSDITGNVENVKALLDHPAFDIKNPNKVCFNLFIYKQRALLSFLFKTKINYCLHFTYFSIICLMWFECTNH